LTDTLSRAVQQNRLRSPSTPAVRTADLRAAAERARAAAVAAEADREFAALTQLYGTAEDAERILELRAEAEEAAASRRDDDA
jgi:hypothetical protein